MYDFRLKYLGCYKICRSCLSC